MYNRKKIAIESSPSDLAISQVFLDECFIVRFQCFDVRELFTLGIQIEGTVGQILVTEMIIA